MTEADWLNGNDLAAMMNLLNERASERKRRLFACACCRRSCNPLDSRTQQVLKRFEAEADAEQVEQSANASIPAECLPFRSFGETSLLELQVHLLSRFILLGRALGTEAPRHRTVDPSHPQDLDSCSLLREVFGNPFRRSIIEPV